MKKIVEWKLMDCKKKFIINQIQLRNEKEINIYIPSIY